MVGERGFEPPTPWSRTRGLKCRAWTRIAYCARPMRDSFDRRESQRIKMSKLRNHLERSRRCIDGFSNLIGAARRGVAQESRALMNVDKAVGFESHEPWALSSRRRAVRERVTNRLVTISTLALPSHKGVGFATSRKGFCATAFGEVLARKLECLDVTQSGPDTSVQSVGRVARLSGNVRQPNHVLAN